MLRRSSWRFNHWFVALQRWQDFPDEEFLTFIDLWVQIRGIPLPYVSFNTIRLIASTLGEVQELEFNEALTTEISFIRAKVRFGLMDPMRFCQRVRFQSGEGSMIGFEYENLSRLCGRCCRITHFSAHCPYGISSDIPLEDSDVKWFQRWKKNGDLITMHLKKKGEPLRVLASRPSTS